MKIISTSSALFILAGSALAATFRQEQTRRAGNHRKIVDRFVGAASVGGAYITGTGIGSVTGSFAVPTDSTPNSYTTFLIALDGETCSTASLQVGVTLTKTGSSIAYDAWYEWYPGYSYDFSGISLSAGDIVVLRLTATSKTSGIAAIENVTTGTTLTHTFTNEASIGSLCEYDAEWIVDSSGDFGSVTFSDCSAGTLGTSGAKVIDSTDISCSIPSSSEVKCTWGEGVISL